MDSLRAFSMLLGIIYHALFTFTGSTPGYFCLDASHGRWAIVAAAVPHGFRVELFYLIGGFFGHLVMSRYGLRGFLRNRGGRILRPFLVAAALLVVLVQALAWYARYIGAAPATFALKWTPAPFYLWFLFYMVMLDAVAVTSVLLTPNSVATQVATWLDARFAWLVRSPLAPWLLALPGGALLALRARGPFFDYVPVPTWIAYDGLFFGFGWWLHRQAELRFSLAPWRWLNATLAVTAFVLLQHSEPSLPPLLVAYLRSAYAWLAALALVGFSVRSFQQPSVRSRYLADASYWVYLAHWPLLTFLQITVASWAWPGVVKVVALVAAVTGLSLLGYQFFIRYTWVGMVLNGPRPRPSPQPALSSPTSTPVTAAR